MRLALLIFLFSCCAATAQDGWLNFPIRNVNTSSVDFASTIDFGGDTSTWANDGECDDPRFVGITISGLPTAESLLSDATDCQTAYDSGLITLNPVQVTDDGTGATCRFAATVSGVGVPMASCLQEFWRAENSGGMFDAGQNCLEGSVPTMASTSWETVLRCLHEDYPTITLFPNATDGALIRDYSWIGQGYGTTAGIGPTPTGGPFLEDGVARPLSPDSLPTPGSMNVTNARGVEIYFATNRPQKPGPRYVEFPGERSDTLTLGKMTVSIPIDHQRGLVESPGTYQFLWMTFVDAEDPTKHFLITSLDVQSEESFLSSVAERQDAGETNKDEAIVYVHGFANSFKDAATRMAQMTYDMQFDGVPIIYSWPSRGPLAQYFPDRETSEASAIYFTRFLKMLLNDSGLKQIHVICHSMGCNSAVRALENLENVDEGDHYAITETGAPAALGEVLFAAPDIDTEIFEDFARTLAGMGMPMTLYASGNDKALLAAGSDFIFDNPRAGFVPAGGVPAVVDGLETIDITALGLDWLQPEHSDFADEAVIMSDIGVLIRTSMRPPNMRANYKTMVDGQGRRFWRY